MHDGRSLTTAPGDGRGGSVVVRRPPERERTDRPVPRWHAEMGEQGGCSVEETEEQRPEPGVGGGEEHRHGGLPEVVLINRQVAFGFGLGKDQDDCRPSPGEVNPS